MSETWLELGVPGNVLRELHVQGQHSYSQYFLNVYNMMVEATGTMRGFCTAFGQVVVEWYLEAVLAAVKHNGNYRTYLRELKLQGHPTYSILIPYSIVVLYSQASFKNCSVFKRDLLKKYFLYILLQ